MDTLGILIRIENSNCTNPSILLEEKGKVVSIKGGCVAGPKLPDDHDCAKLGKSTICTCNFRSKKTKWFCVSNTFEV